MDEKDVNYAKDQLKVVDDILSKLKSKGKTLTDEGLEIVKRLKKSVRGVGENQELKRKAEEEAHKISESLRTTIGKVSSMIPYMKDALVNDSSSVGSKEFSGKEYSGSNNNVNQVGGDIEEKYKRLKKKYKKLKKKLKSYKKTCRHSGTMIW